jgi:peptidyl-prolyl cis-trans isomerase B (cyclophilin B)
MKNNFLKVIIVLFVIVVAVIAGMFVKKQLNIREMKNFVVENAAITDQAQIDMIEEQIKANYDTLLPTYKAQKAAKKDQDKKSNNAKPADPELVVEENPVATIVVKDYGTMTFELYPNDAPQTVYNFIELANSGFYNGLTFHRLIEDFVVQGGDPDGTGTGGPGYTIEGEFPSNGVANPHQHEVGTLAMARSQDPDSAGSQFYIVTGEEGASLSDDYTAFGMITSGQDVLTALNTAPVDGETPTEPIVIESVTVDTKGVDYPSPEKNDVN